MARIGPAAALLIAFCFVGGSRSSQYFGKLIGKLSELHHGLSGEVYAVDGRTFYIKDFTYDGQGPAAYFYANTNKEADKSGFRLRDENGNGNPIRRYRKEGITLTLPEGKTLNNVKILYVWCEDFDVNFGDVKIPRNFDYPRPQKIAPLNGVHSVSSDNIVIVDAQTLLVPNFFYDGEAPDAKFWVGRGAKPSPQGIRVPDENGKEAPLKRYDGKTLVLTLPGDLTVFDIGHFGVWCEQFTVDFGHVIIPSNTLNAAPPSLRMLGVSPQKIHQHQQQQQQATANKVSRPLVGGHLQPTTFRPPSLFSIFSRRNSDQPTVFMNQQGEVFAQNQVGQQYHHRAQPLVGHTVHQQTPFNQAYNHIQPYIQAQHQPQVQVQVQQQLINQQQLPHHQLQHQPIHQLGYHHQSNNLHAQIQLMANLLPPHLSPLHQNTQVQNQFQTHRNINQIHDPNAQSTLYLPVNFSEQQQQKLLQQQQQQQNNLASIDRRQYQEQLAYDQAKRQQEEEYLRNNLSRQHNRFILPTNQNFNIYG